MPDWGNLQRSLKTPVLRESEGRGRWKGRAIDEMVREGKV